MHIQPSLLKSKSEQYNTKQIYYIKYNNYTTIILHNTLYFNNNKQYT